VVEFRRTEGVLARTNYTEKKKGFLWFSVPSRKSDGKKQMKKKKKERDKLENQEKKNKKEEEGLCLWVTMFRGAKNQEIKITREEEEYKGCCGFQERSHRIMKLKKKTPASLF
jgi:hypothetical protein